MSEKIQIDPRAAQHINHQINNAASVILMFSELIRVKRADLIDQDSFLDEKLAAIEQAAQQLLALREEITNGVVPAE